MVSRTLVVAFVLLLAACGGGGGGADVAATVNGVDIPVADVEARIDQAMRNPQVADQVSADPAARQALQTQVLSRMVEFILLDQAAEDVGVTVTDEEITARLDQLKAQFGGEEAFQAGLEQQGIPQEDVNLQVRALVLGEKIQEQVGSGVAEDAITPEQVQQVYDQQFDGGEPVARHILVATEQEAAEIKAEIDGGADFAELARERSTDTTNAGAGGLLGEVIPGQLVPEFEQAVTAASDGEVVGPVQTQFGFHVIQRLASPPPHEIVDPGIREQLLDAQRAQVFDDFVGEQRSKATVQINPLFGQWDAETGQIVSGDPLGEPLQSPAPQPS